MSKKIYKYISADIFDIIFNKEGFCGFKFSLPKDYNDPYELFLTIDFKNDPERVAFYNEVINSLTQFPTTCFSNSPIVHPIWAHYANNSTGLVLEIDETELLRYLPSATIDDVVYRDKPREELERFFNMAYFRKKPRDFMFLRRAVCFSAYFTKHLCWSTENERRMIITKDDVTNISGNMVFFFPVQCISSIICGSLATQGFKKKALEFAKSIGVQYLESNIGRNTSSLFFCDSRNRSYIFKNKAIRRTRGVCRKCNEPISSKEKICPWCMVTEQDVLNAASNNTLRMLHEAGLLEEYVEGFNKI